MNLRFLIIIAICVLNYSKTIAQKSTNGQKGYEIKVKIEQYTEDTLMLAYRLGAKTYIRDTAVGKDQKGFHVFKRDTLLDGGVYLILIKPNNNYFEFLISGDESQKLNIHTKIEGNDMVKNLKIEGCNDNKVFIDYLHYLGNKNKESESANKRALELDSMLKSPMATESEKENWTKEKTKHIDFLQGLSKEVEKYQKDMINRNPSYLSSKLILSSQPPVIPKDIEALGQPHTYFYFKNHYWDNFDWADKRMIRTPVFEQKIEYYLEKLTVQMPDSCILGCDFILGNVIKGGNKDMYQFASSHLLNKFAASKVICMDKVYVHLGDRYYCGALKPTWVDSAQLEKICENVNDLRYALCGQQAPEIELTNIATNQKIKLSSIKARFTAVYFWDPACGNCTKNSQKFVPVYEKWKSKGLEVYGICSKSIDEVEECKKKIDEVGMKWINTTDKSYPLAYIKKYYDVKMNPFLYLLDKDKKILYKRIDPEQLDDILNREIEMAEKEAKGQK
jgi:peroxiredoxin